MQNQFSTKNRDANQQPECVNNVFQKPRNPKFRLKLVGGLLLLALMISLYKVSIILAFVSGFVAIANKGNFSRRKHVLGSIVFFACAGVIGFMISPQEKTIGVEGKSKKKEVAKIVANKSDERSPLQHTIPQDSKVGVTQSQGDSSKNRMASTSTPKSLEKSDDYENWISIGIFVQPKNSSKGWDTGGGKPEVKGHIVIDGHKLEINGGRDKSLVFHEFPNIELKNNSKIDVRLVDDDALSDDTISTASQKCNKSGCWLFDKYAWIWITSGRLSEQWNPETFIETANEAKKKRDSLDWKKSLADRSKYYGSSKSKLLSAKLLKKYKNPKQDWYYTESILYPDEKDGYFVVIKMREMNVSQSIQSYSKHRGIMGMSRYRLVIEDGRSFRQSDELGEYMTRYRVRDGSVEEYFDIGTGEKVNFRLFFSVPSSIDKKHLYLEIFDKNVDELPVAGENLWRIPIF